ncbi:MAG TPA: MFS transporter [Trebonia sp.]|jgi:MFS family permease|nr:MFS transporter [Trebonia sp.]
MSSGRKQSRRLAGRVLMDLTPVKLSRDFRWLLGGQLVSILGTQLTAVAVPYQVYSLTKSSLDVGLVSLAQLFPLIIGSLLGGSLVDSVDRRKLLMIVETAGAIATAGLAINADTIGGLWPLFVFPAATAALSGVDSSARNAMVPGLVGLSLVPSANAMFQSLFQMGGIVGPALAGLLLAGAGVKFVYWLNVASFLVSVLCVLFMSPQPPAAGAVARPGLRSVAEGFRFVGRSQPIQGAYLIDINAMVFGMPRALFPALAATAFGGGATTVGLLYAAPGAGALIGAVTTGWVARIRRQALAVIIAVMVWGAAISLFGLAPWLWAALVLLAIAGWADVISAVFRNTIIAFAAPDKLRGRLMGVQIAVVAGGPRLGDLEAGAVAEAFGNTASVVSGGLACIVGALLVARLLPGFRNQRVPAVTGGGKDGAEATEMARAAGSAEATGAARAAGAAEEARLLPGAGDVETDVVS